MTELTRDNFLFYAKEMIETALNISSLHNRFERYGLVIARAKELDLEAEAEQLAKNILDDFGMTSADLWELPKKFGASAELAPFPMQCLPEVLHNILKATAEYVQVFPEMGALVLLSAIALSTQAKATVTYPGNSYSVQLTLYTLTIAKPGERKSGSFKEFMQPIYNYEKHWNEVHSGEIAAYKTQRAYLNNQKEAALKGKNANVERAKEIDKEIAELVPIHPKKFFVNDVTPEALAWEMYLQGGKIAIMDDEGTIFNILSGIYSGGSANIDIVLKAYDGSPYRISRRTKEDIVLDKPLLTMGLMTQPSEFQEITENKKFKGKGLLQRFLFSFPQSMAGNQNFKSPNIPLDVKQRYYDLIDKLLNMKCPNDEPYVLRFDREGALLIEQYHNELQKSMKPGGRFEYLQDYAQKQMSKCLKIAGILHLCEYEPTELINGKTTMNAINISMWCENQALKALGELAENPVERDARYILDRIKKNGEKQIRKRELQRMCQRFTCSDEMTEPLELLEDMHYIRIETVQPGKKGGRPKEQIAVNPLVFE